MGGHVYVAMMHLIVYRLTGAPMVRVATVLLGDSRS